MHRIGIRREDKSQWERRVPLAPAHVAPLIAEEGLSVIAQSSPIRIYADEEYRNAGAEVSDSLAECGVVMGVKEIPASLLMANRAYVCFSHTIKGQPENMPLLQAALDYDATLIDYELITDKAGRRLVFFGRHAGVAGMIDSLWSLGQRLRAEGVASPFDAIEPTHRYDDMAAACDAVRRAGEKIASDGLPESMAPLVCGITGYGNVSRGAQEIFDLLPVVDVAASDLATLKGDRHHCYKVVFQEQDLVVHKEDGKSFDLQEYYEAPHNYRGVFPQYAPHLSMLINCIYWDARYPKLMTKSDFSDLFASGSARLKVVGDITCDIDGSLECTTHATTPDNPTFIFDVEKGVAVEGPAGNGPLVLAVDFLPCELPRDASMAFGDALFPLVPSLAKADYTKDLAEIGLPESLQMATITHRGKLMPRFEYLQAHL
ncbi:MAG: bifunctional lysine ketoglutarate reductase /saccharopine dehydrogenase family protein [Phycisphaerae bacterium]